MNTPLNSFGCAVCLVTAPFHQVQMRPKWIKELVDQKILKSYVSLSLLVEHGYYHTGILSGKIE